MNNIIAWFVIENLSNESSNIGYYFINANYEETHESYVTMKCIYRITFVYTEISKFVNVEHFRLNGKKFFSTNELRNISLSALMFLNTFLSNKNLFIEFDIIVFTAHFRFGSLQSNFQNRV